jgi:hypothetical protein
VTFSRQTVLLGSSHHLPDGRRVRLRLPHARDRRELAALAGWDEVRTGRELRVRPGERVAVCAVTWDDGLERLVGFAAGDRDAGAPDVVVADEPRAPGVGRLLARAVAERSAGRRVA